MGWKKCMPFFDICKELLELFRIYFAWCLSSSFCLKGHMVWKKMMFEEFQDACSVLDPL